MLARHERVGLEGLLAPRARRGRLTEVPAPAAEEGFRWGVWDGRTPTWWPQGIDVRPDEGGPGGRLLVVSWYAQRRRVAAAARLSFVRLRPGERPRYQHVLLVEPLPDGGSTPIAVHAGGIAWHEDRVYVADTFGGMRLFRVGDILRVRRRWRHGLRGFRYVLPQEAAFEALTPDGARRMRYSFVSLETGEHGPQFVVGEYRDGDDGRLARIPLDPGARVSTLAFHAPALRRMQGVCVVDGTWFVTTSSGTLPGDLWAGEPGNLVRREGVLPPGPEDLAREPGTRMLWSLSEHPGRRFVYRIDPDRWIPERNHG